MKRLKQLQGLQGPTCACGHAVNKHIASPTTNLQACTECHCTKVMLAGTEHPAGQPSTVNHPSYYGGESNPYEAIKVIEAWELDFCLGNTVKYISRAGKKDPAKELEDLQKAAWYLNRRIEQLIKKQ